MPLYDYKCTKCGHIFEIQQKISEEPLKYCPECKGPIKRLISASGIIFKGSGFHVTDYGRGRKSQSPSNKHQTSPKSQISKTKTESKGKEVKK